MSKTKRRALDMRPGPELRERAIRMGITEESAGMSIDELVDQAVATDDPVGYLSTFAPGASPEVPEPATAGEPLPAPAEPAAAIAGTRFLTIRVPVGPIPAGCYVSNHVESKLPDIPQARALKALVVGLELEQRRPSQGPRSVAGAEVIRWFLQAVADAAAEEGLPL